MQGLKEVKEELKKVYKSRGKEYLSEYINDNGFGLSFANWRMLKENLDSNGEPLDMASRLIKEFDSKVLEGQSETMAMAMNFLISIFNKQPTIQGNVVKVNVPSLNGGNYISLSNLFMSKGIKGVDSKRSGSGITVLVTVME